MPWPRLREGEDGLCVRERCDAFAAFVAPDGSHLCFDHAVRELVRIQGSSVVDFNKWEQQLKEDP
jgi:hypothetical protein